MKQLQILILLLSLAVGCFAQQPDYAGINHAIQDFDKALESKDSVALNWLLSDKLIYGHSNGWTETKREVIEDLYNGKLTYKKVLTGGIVTKTNGNVAAVRSEADIDAVMGGKLLSFKLKVLQTWIWENEHWVLFARQSVSVPKEK